MKRNEKKFLKNISNNIDSNMDFEKISQHIDYNNYKKVSNKFCFFKSFKFVLASFMFLISFLTIILVQDELFPTKHVTTTTTVALNTENNLSKIYPELKVFFNQKRVYDINISDKVEILSNGMYKSNEVYFDFYDKILEEKSDKHIQNDNNQIRINSSINFNRIGYVRIYKITLENNNFVRTLDESIQYDSSEFELIININKNENVVGYYVQAGLIYHTSKTEGRREHIGSLILFE